VSSAQIETNETEIDKDSVSPYQIKKLQQDQGIMVSDESVKHGHESFAWILTPTRLKNVESKT